MHAASTAASYTRLGIILQFLSRSPLPRAATCLPSRDDPVHTVGDHNDVLIYLNGSVDALAACPHTVMHGILHHRQRKPSLLHSADGLSAEGNRKPACAAPEETLCPENKCSTCNLEIPKLAVRVNAN